MCPPLPLGVEREVTFAEDVDAPFLDSVHLDDRRTDRASVKLEGIGESRCLRSQFAQSWTGCKFEEFERRSDFAAFARSIETASASLEVRIVPVARVLLRCYPVFGMDIVHRLFTTPQCLVLNLVCALRGRVLISARARRSMSDEAWSREMHACLRARRRKRSSPCTAASARVGFEPHERTPRAPTGSARVADQ